MENSQLKTFETHGFNGGLVSPKSWEAFKNEMCCNNKSSTYEDCLVEKCVLQVKDGSTIEFAMDLSFPFVSDFPLQGRHRCWLYHQYQVNTER